MSGMHQAASIINQKLSDTKPLNSLRFGIVPEVLVDLAHLDLSAHFTFKETQVVSGGAYGDISKGECRVQDGKKNIDVAVKRLRFFLAEDIKLVSTLLHCTVHTTKLIIECYCGSYSRKKYMFGQS